MGSHNEAHGIMDYNWVSDAAVPRDQVRLMLIRHAQTKSNAEGQWHGDEDESISEAGQEASEKAAERLRASVDGNVTLVLSSHLRRAIETARILAMAVKEYEVI
jgi:broad specificity phosphatase PhoE